MNNDNIKIAMCSMMNNDFYIAYVSFMKSLLWNNPWIYKQAIPFIIIDLDISDSIKMEMLELYPYVDFRQPNKSMYSKVRFQKTLPVLQCTYYKLDMFSYDDYDRIVFLDLDMNVVGDIEFLFNCIEPISATHGYDRNMDKLREDINSGVVVLNKPHINEKVYKDIVKYSEQGFSMPDQKAIWGKFYKKVNIIPKIYNCEKRISKSASLKDIWNNRRIVHWISEKPWQAKKEYESNKGYENIEKSIWDYWYNFDKEKLHEKLIS